MMNKLRQVFISVCVFFCSLASANSNMNGACEVSMNSVDGEDELIVILSKFVDASPKEIASVMQSPYGPHFETLATAYKDLVLSHDMVILAKLAQMINQDAPKRKQDDNALRFPKERLADFDKFYSPFLGYWLSSIAIPGDRRFVDRSQVGERIKRALSTTLTNSEALLLAQHAHRIGKLRGFSVDSSGKFVHQKRVIEAVRSHKFFRVHAWRLLNSLDSAVGALTFARLEHKWLSAIFQFFFGKFRFEAGLTAEQWRAIIAKKRSKIKTYLFLQDTELKPIETLAVEALAVEGVVVEAKDLRADLKRYLKYQAYVLLNDWRAKNRSAIDTTLLNGFKAEALTQINKESNELVTGQEAFGYRIEPKKKTRSAVINTAPEVPAAVQTLAKAVKNNSFDLIVAAINDEYFSSNAFDKEILQHLIRFGSQGKDLTGITPSQINFQDLVDVMLEGTPEHTLGAMRLLTHILPYQVVRLKQVGELDRILKFVSEKAKKIDTKKKEATAAFVDLNFVLVRADVGLSEEQERLLLKTIGLCIKTKDLVRVNDILNLTEWMHKSRYESVGRDVRTLLSNTLKPTSSEKLPDDKDISVLKNAYLASQEAPELTKGVLLAVLHDNIAGYQTSGVREIILSTATKLPSEHWLVAELLRSGSITSPYLFSKSNIFDSKVADLYRNLLIQPDTFDDGLLEMIVEVSDLMPPGGNLLSEDSENFIRANRLKEALSTAITMKNELLKGWLPIDVSGNPHYGYDVLSINTKTGEQRHIEVKERQTGWTNLYVSRHELETSERIHNGVKKYYIYLVELDSAQLNTELRFFENPTKTFLSQFTLPQSNPSKILIRHDGLRLLEVFQ